MIRFPGLIKECSITMILAMMLLMGVKMPLFAQKWDPKDYRYYHDPDIATTKKAEDGRGSTFYRDPFIWVYTSDFARRHGMPMEWVDDSLEGVAAITFRHISSNAVQCGFFGDKNACSLRVDCQMDFYIPKSANLPWVDERKQGFVPRTAFRSMRYLQRQINGEQLYIRNPRASHPGIRSMGISIYRPENLSLAFGRWPKETIGYYGSTSSNVREFDRTFLPHLDYISTHITCGQISKKEAEQGATPVAHIREHVEKAPRDGKIPFAYQFVIPNSFWLRVGKFHEKNYNQKGTLFEMIRERMRKGPKQR